MAPGRPFLILVLVLEISNKMTIRHVEGPNEAQARNKGRENEYNK